MTQIETNCSSCGGIDFEDGFAEDVGSVVGNVRWLPGALKKGLFGGAARMGKPRWDISVLRCRACNHLELYATPPD